MEGKIIKCISNDYTIKNNNGEYICKPRGLFRKNKITPLVGDNVIFDEVKKVILSIKERKNELIRPPISNVDIALIITSVESPKLNLNLLDKMISIVEYKKIKPIIIFSKIDLLEDLNEIKKIVDYYKNIGYKVYFNNDLENIKKIFKNKITVITGQSGVGKSTFLNSLSPKLELKTNEISKALGRGKHTTRTVQLYDLLGGLIADTPGFSSLDFINMSKQNIKDGFIEFSKYRCKYSDCMHINEEDCEIKKMVKLNNILESRYNNYKKFIEIGGENDSKKSNRNS